jgi:hypothetical protein
VKPQRAAIYVLNFRHHRGNFRLFQASGGDDWGLRSDLMWGVLSVLCMAELVHRALYLYDSSNMDPGAILSEYCPPWRSWRRGGTLFVRERFVHPVFEVA